jgi:hypothetical protein
LYSLHRISVFLISFFLSSTAPGSNPYRLPAGAAEAGMGSLCIMRSGFWSSFQNQALLPYYKSIAAGINYESRFNISELGTRSAGVIIPVGRASLGVIYSYFGYSQFRRETGGLACGLRLTEKISAGIQADYFSEKAAGEYINNHSITFEAGLSFIPEENIIVGLHIFNPLPNSFHRSFMPSSLRAGAGIELSKDLFAGAEAEMSSGRNLILRTGFEYEAVKKLFLRGGFSSENTSFTFGLGYLLKSLKLDLGFATHEKLGITSSVSIVLQIR